MQEMSKQGGVSKNVTYIFLNMFLVGVGGGPPNVSYIC